MKLRRRWWNALTLVPPTIWAAGLLIPLGAMLLISLKTRPDYAVDPMGFPSALDFQNYATAWTTGNLNVALVNNVVVTVSAVVLVAVLGSLAAFAIVRWVGRGGRRLYAYFALGLIVPFQLGLPTLFKIWVQLGLADTLPGLILVHLGAALPLAIFIYSGFLLSVPMELEEAARVDGAGDVRVFVSVVFPLLRPATATVVVFTAIGVWNDLIVSLFFVQSASNMTLSKSALSFSSEYNSNIPVVFAFAILTVIPIIVVFVAFQKYFLSGLTQGALRG